MYYPLLAKELELKQEVLNIQDSDEIILDIPSEGRVDVWTFAELKNNCWFSRNLKCLSEMSRLENGKLYVKVV